METSPILVCFAVKEEAKSLLRSDGWKTLITGMGKKNAAASFRNALATMRPRLVITSGFAGGLNPEFKWRTIVFDEDEEAGLAPKLLKKRAVPARFLCADRVAITAAEKEQLWKSTGCDAVEMESSVIRSICRENNIPSATIRVISDPADYALPLDFNLLMTPDYRINYLKLAATLVRKPGKISELLAFQANLSFAQRDLVFALSSLLLD